jgi:hypothetical protein
MAGCSCHARWTSAANSWQDFPAITRKQILGGGQNFILLFRSLIYRHCVQKRGQIYLSFQYTEKVDSKKGHPTGIKRRKKLGRMASIKMHNSN